MTHTGFYSIIQFCPDWQRLEVANVGVVLFCEDLEYFRAKIEPGKGRIQQLFGNSLGNIDYVQRFKEDMQFAFDRDAQKVKTLDAMQEYCSQWVNHFVFTKPRPTLVPGDPGNSLNQLYEELFADTVPKISRSRQPNIRGHFLKGLQKEMGARFKKEIMTSFDVSVENLGDKIRADVGFQNGVFNAIRMQTLTQKHAREFVCSEAFIGNLLFETPHARFGAMKLILLCNNSNKDPVEHKQIKKFGEVLQANQVGFYFGENGQRELHSIIRDTAHELPAHYSNV